MELMNWAPEHSGALREHHALGMSSSEIARAVNAKFNTHYSRNAVIGRAKRMGLARIDRPRDLTPPAPQDQQPSLSRLRERRAVPSGWYVPVFEREEIPGLRCADVDPRHLSLLDLEASDCRYPYGGDEEGEAITFCGHPRRRGSSYCSAHFHLTIGPGTAAERAADSILLNIMETA